MNDMEGAIVRVIRPGHSINLPNSRGLGRGRKGSCRCKITLVKRRGKKNNGFSSSRLLSLKYVPTEVRSQVLQVGLTDGTRTGP